MRHSRPLLVATAALSVGAALLPAAASASAPAPDQGRVFAATTVVKVSGWTRLSSQHVTSLSEPAALPLGTGGMQAIWYQQDGSSSESIRTRIVTEAGRVATDILPVVTGWATIVDDPKIIEHGAEHMVVFGGIRTTNPGEKFYGPMAYATSTDGKTWTLGSGSLTQTASAYASYGTAAVDDAGTPLVGVVASSTSFVTLHRGISTSVPAPSGDWTTTSLSGNSLYASLGRDSATGSTWAVWNQAFGTAKQNGVIAQRVYPTPIGAWKKAPQSTDKAGDVTTTDQDVAVASRKGGQVWAAYPIGYPTANKIGLWRVGSTQSFTVRAKDVNHITLSPAPGGRLWLAWSNSSTGKIFATRTNANVSRVGVVRALKPPTKKGSFTNVWRLAGSGAGGPLHLLVNAQIGTADPQIWYQKVLPGLSLVASPHKLSDGTVTAKVSDAGTPIANAKVTFLGTTKRTGANGTVTFRVSKSVKSGKYAMTAVKSGYARGHGIVTVT